MASRTVDRLSAYREKRDFEATAEPSGEGRRRPRGKALAFCVQKHDATRLHYDFRVEWDGVLKSWAVTRGPSLDPAEKRLAVRTEDHPLDYGDFEGTIPPGQYGGGTVMLWDRGTWEPEPGTDPDEGLSSGALKMVLHGEKMEGRWALIRMRPKAEETRENWLLVKEKDEAADAERDLLAEDRSVKTGRGLAEIAAGGTARSSPAKRGRAEKSATSEERNRTETARKRRKPDAEVETSVAGVRLTHPGRAVFPGVSKGDIAAYYEAVAERMLVHAGRHAVSLVRCPQGPKRHCFFQKHESGGFPKAIRKVAIEEKDGAREDYFCISDVAGLVAAVQMNALEFHIWGAPVSRIETPDRLVFDLDPDEGLPFSAVRDAALHLRNRLGHLGLESLALVTGGKGVHVVVPLTGRQGWETAKGFAREVATKLETEDPGRFVATMSKARRHGRIFVDWLRNERGATAIAPYSTRARDGCPVAVPVSWAELETLDRANGFDIAATLARLGEPDPWADYGQIRQSLTKTVLSKLAKL